MSLKGITFDLQEVTAKNDGNIYANQYLNDGIINGCEVVFADASVTVKSGYFIAGGRVFEVSGDTTTPLTPSLSTGYARLVVAIDLTQQPSDTAFTQAAFRVDYSTTEIFPDLVQEDINADGTTYEMQISVLRIANGIAVELITAMPKAYTGAEAWSAKGKTIVNNADNIADGVTVCNINTPIEGQYSYCYVIQSTLDDGVKMQIALSMYQTRFGMYERRRYTDSWSAWNNVGGTSGKVTLDYANTAILNKSVTFPGFSAATHNVIATPIYNNTSGVMLRKGMVSVVYGTGAFTVSLVAMQGQTYSSADAGKVEVAYNVQRI